MEKTIIESLFAEKKQKKMRFFFLKKRCCTWKKKSFSKFLETLFYGLKVQKRTLFWIFWMKNALNVRKNSVFEKQKIAKKKNNVFKTTFYFQKK